MPQQIAEPRVNPIDLPWLLPPPENFRSELRALRASPEWQPERVRRLAMTSLNVVQLCDLAALFAAVPDSNIRGTWLQMSVLTNASTNLLVPAISATAARHDLFVNVETHPFGSFVQEALDPKSATNTRNNDFILLALDHRAFGFHFQSDETSAATVVESAMRTLWALVASLRGANGAATIIVQTLAPPPEQLFGNLV